MMDTDPPVFVMNVYYTGIGIARSLHARGVKVYGLSSEDNAPGIHSRCFRGIYRVPNGRDEPANLCRRLVDIARRYPERPVIFPTRDIDVLFLADYAEQLAPHYRMPPSAIEARRMMDKLQLAAVAERTGIATPRTMNCSSSDDAIRAGDAFMFPVVVKPRSAHEWRRKGAWHRVGMRKAILVTTAAQLVSVYESLQSISKEVLIQEYVAGTDADIVVCCCYIGRDGRMLGNFTGRKLRQSPPLFGTGCVVEAAPVPLIVPLTERLLGAFGYNGLAEVEFKQDKNTGRYVLIEVNPRHWDQHELGRLVGVDLSWVAYQESIGRRPAPCEPHFPTSRGPRWIAEREALMLIARNVLHDWRAENAAMPRTRSRLSIARAAVAEAFEMFRRPRVCSILSTRDPLPGAFFLSRLFREVIVGAMHLAMNRRA